MGQGWGQALRSRIFDAVDGFSAEVLATLASSPDVTVRAGLAARTDLPAQTMLRLACDGSPQVRAVLAGNHSLPRAAAALDKLCYDGDATVRLALIGNSVVPMDALQRISMRPRLPMAFAGSNDDSVG